MKLGRVVPSGTVIFRDENSEHTWMYLLRVPEGNTRPSAPSGSSEKELSRKLLSGPSPICI
jgi:hypothetical protein